MRLVRMSTRAAKERTPSGTPAGVARLPEDEDIRALLRPWCRRYRPAIAATTALGMVVAGAVYLQNAALRALSESFLAFVPPGALGSLEFVRRFVPTFRLPLLILAWFALLHGVRLLAEHMHVVLTAAIRNRVRTDFESALLAHLLRHEERGGTERPVAEILARLDQDVSRVVENRVTRSAISHACFVVAANLFYMARIEPRIGMTLLLACGTVAWVMQRLGSDASDIDQRQVRASDRVRSAIEETLWARREIHAGGLLKPAQARVSKVQTERQQASLRSAWFQARLHAVNGSSYIATLAAVCVGIYFDSATTPDARAALIPVLLKVVPELFASTRAISDGIVEITLARSSEDRLLEFETPPRPPTTAAPLSPGSDVSIVLDATTYQYAAPGGGRQGGVVDVSLSFRPGTWTAISGQSGSGKSTLAQLILGRLSPQQGTATLGECRVADLSDPERAQLITFMPESATLLDGSIRTNLAFGRRANDEMRPLTPAQSDFLEATGLGPICRMKALDLHPTAADVTSPFGQAIARLRGEFRARAAEVGVAVSPFEAGGGADTALVAELLLGARCERGEAISRLLSPTASLPLRALARTPLGERIRRVAERVLSENRALLSAETYVEYTRLSSSPVEERLWTIRRAELRAPARHPIAMMHIGLTATRSDIGEVFERTASRDETAPLRAILGDATIPLDPEAIHPALTWRENALFGGVSLSNRRAADRLDAALLNLLSGHALLAEITDRGLDYEVGSNGTRLSTGQRQLVAICRALLRDTAVLVLDEPTSALDAASRGRIAAVLGRWKQGRILVTITHDEILMRAADAVHVVEGGRVVSTDTKLREPPPPHGAPGGEVSVA